MAAADRRQQQRAARRRLIIATARTVAEAEGWDAVTTRRLAAEVGYSQPVLYHHFTGMEQLTDVVALDGFVELAGVIHAARSDADAASEALIRVAHAYLDFARDNPAVYDAMFTRATTLHFAVQFQDTPPQLAAAFGEVRDAVGVFAEEPEALTEVFWAALHGLVTLSRGDLLRRGFNGERLRLVIAVLNH